jgi:signal recognition particle receptor subunit beta
MAYEDSNSRPDVGGAQAVKILIAGGFGAGKTTLVSAVSEIAPLRTEERLSQIGASVDDLTGVAGKATTTVALDFGRITISPEVVLYLFGTPGQDRFWFMWKELSAGALGAVVLADTRRITDCFAALDFFETRGIPFIVGVNCFDGAGLYAEDEVRHALDIGPRVPIQFCDARHRGSAKEVLARLLEYLMATARTSALGTLRLVQAGGEPIGHAGPGLVGQLRARDQLPYVIESKAGGPRARFLLGYGAGKLPEGGPVISRRWTAERSAEPRAGSSADRNARLRRPQGG